MPANRWLRAGFSMCWANRVVSKTASESSCSVWSYPCRLMQGRPIAAPDDDPYLWLEEIEGAARLAWVDAQNARTLAALRRRASSRPTATTLAAIFDRPDKIPFIARRGAVLLQFLEGRRASARPLAAHDARELPQRAARTGTCCSTSTRWRRPRARTGSGAAPSTRPGTHDRAIVRLSRGGSDAVVLREFDLARKAVRGRRLRPARGQGQRELARRRHAAADQRLAAAMVTTSGYARTVRLWRRGTEAASRRRSCSRCRRESMSACGGDRPHRGRAADLVLRRDRLLRREGLARRPHGPKTRLDLPTDVQIDAHRGWLAVKPRTAWTVGGKT